MTAYHPVARATPAGATSPGDDTGPTPPGLVLSVLGIEDAWAPPRDPLEGDLRRHPAKAWQLGKLVPNTYSADAQLYAAGRATESTRRTYLSAYRTFGLFCSGGDEELARNVPSGVLSVEVVLAYRTAMEAKGATTATIAKNMTALRMLAKDLGADPRIGRLESVKVGERQPSPIPEEQYQATIRAVRHHRLSRTSRGKSAAVQVKSLLALRDEAIIRLMGEAGLRRAEVATLLIGDIDAKGPPGSGRREQRLSVAEAERTTSRWWVHVIGKGDHERYVPLNEATADAVLAWQANRPAPDGADDDRPLFLARPPRLTDPWTSPLSPRQVAHIVSSYTAEAGVDEAYRHPHALRHRFVTWMANRGVSIEVIRQLAGHKDIRTTALYRKVDADVLDAAVAAANEEHVSALERAARAA